MAIKILTQNGIDNTNVDGARANNFNAGNRSGFVKGAFNEGRIFASTTNTIALDTCELRLSGHQIVITDIMQQTFNNAPPTDLRMSWVAEIKVANDSTPTFRLFVQDSDAPIVQDHLFATENGVGTYQLELCKFTHTTRNSIEDIIRTADIITGGTGSGGDSELVIGKVTTSTLAAGLDAEVDIENVVDPQTGKKKTNFNFGIPQGKDGQVLSQAELDKKLDKTEHLNFNQVFSPNMWYVANNGDCKRTINPNNPYIMDVDLNSSKASDRWAFSTTELDSSHQYYIDIILINAPSTILVANNRTIFSGRPIYPYCAFRHNVQVTAKFQLKVNLIDLTEMFGTGNEPKTVEEVQQYIKPNTYYPYTKGKASIEQVNEVGMALSDNVIENIFTNLNDATADTYIAPANGYVNVLFASNSPISNGLFTRRISDSKTLYNMTASPTGYNNEYYMSVPCAKGQKVVFLHMGGVLTRLVSKFVYAEEV